MSCSTCGQKYPVVSNNPTSNTVVTHPPSAPLNRAVRGIIRNPVYEQKHIPQPLPKNKQGK